jgi:hypothetical protein
MHVGRRGKSVTAWCARSCWSALSRGMQSEETMNDLSAGAGATYAITELEEANLPPVPPVTALLKDKELEFYPRYPRYPR